MADNLTTTTTAATGAADWDNEHIYKATMTPSTNGWAVWYTAQNTAVEWFLGRVALDNT